MEKKCSDLEYGMIIIRGLLPHFVKLQANKNPAVFKHVLYPLNVLPVFNKFSAIYDQRS